MQENTPQTSYLPYLTQAGLDQDQATIYECLIKNGQLPAGKISQKTPIKRGLVYKILETLTEMGLVIKHEEPKKVAVFEPAHPLKLKELAEKKEEQAKSAQDVLSSILPVLTSDFNLASNKPGFQYFEGLEGVKRVAEDSLHSKTEILSYIDNEAVNLYLKDFNVEYSRRRNALQVKKRMLAKDSEYIRARAKTFDQSTTEVRTINVPTPFATVMQIYDNKISYITLDPKRMISVLIEDQHIAQMHRMLFEQTWTTSTPLTKNTP